MSSNRKASAPCGCGRPVTRKILPDGSCQSRRRCRRARPSRARRACGARRRKPSLLGHLPGLAQPLEEVAQAGRPASQTASIFTSWVSAGLNRPRRRFLSKTARPIGRWAKVSVSVSTKRRSEASAATRSSAASAKPKVSPLSPAVALARTSAAPAVAGRDRDPPGLLRGCQRLLQHVAEASLMRSGRTPLRVEGRGRARCLVDPAVAALAPGRAPADGRRCPEEVIRRRTARVGPVLRAALFSAAGTTDRKVRRCAAAQRPRRRAVAAWQWWPSWCRRPAPRRFCSDVRESVAQGGTVSARAGPPAERLSSKSARRWLGSSGLMLGAVCIRNGGPRLARARARAVVIGSV